MIENILTELPNLHTLTIPIYKLTTIELLMNQNPHRSLILYSIELKLDNLQINYFKKIFVNLVIISSHTDTNILLSEIK